jgi:nucleoporin p58/p45
MGQSTNQQTVPGVRIDLANVKGTTKFSDLTPELQKQVEQCDNIIQTFKGHADQIAQFRAGHTGDLERLTHDVNWLQRKFDGVKTTLEDDVKVVANLKDLVKSDADIAKAAFKGAEQLKLPAHYHTTWLTASKPAEKTPERDEGDPDLEDCITLFSKEAGRLDELHRFQVQKIREMEQHMPGVENGLYERMRALRDGAPQFPAFGYAVELLDVTKALGDEIVRAAGVIIETREKLTEIQLRPLPSSRK